MSISTFSILLLLKNINLGANFLITSIFKSLNSNVWCIKIRTKDSSKTLLSLVRFLMHQTLKSKSFEFLSEKSFNFVWPLVKWKFKDLSIQLMMVMGLMGPIVLVHSISRLSLLVVHSYLWQNMRSKSIAKPTTSGWWRQLGSRKVGSWRTEGAVTPHSFSKSL